VQWRALIVIPNITGEPVEKSIDTVRRVSMPANNALAGEKTV
jgi:hypothetical protein